MNISKLKYRLLIFLAVFGPATITAIADNDAAGVATYSLVGAKFGYSILFIMFIVMFLLAITQEMGVRIAIITRKGLGDLIRERYGIKISLLVFTVLCIANLGTIIADLSAIKITAEMFKLPSIAMIIAIIVVAFIFIWRGNYKTNQKIFLFITVFYIAYIISAFKSKPNWTDALLSTFTPASIKLTKEFIFATIAVIGTSITPWGQFFVHSFVLDKKLLPNQIKYEQLETYFGAFLTTFFSFFIVVATASTLFVHNIHLKTAEEAALAIKPFAGELASVLFALGIFNAGFMGIVIVSLSTAYAFTEFFGVEGSLDSTFSRGKLFYGLFLAQLIIAGIIVMIPSVSLFKIVFYTQSLNAILLPVVFYFLLKIINNKDLLGTYTNKKWYNYFAIIASILIVGATVFTIASSLFNL